MNSLNLNPKTFSEGWTQSEISTLDECGYKWYLMYNLRLSNTDPNWYFLVGSAWHRIMETMYNNKGKKWEPAKIIFDEYTEESSEREALAEQWEKILNVYAEEYLRLYFDEFASLQIEGVEDEADLEIEWKDQTIRLRGLIDLRGNLLGQQVLYDHKSSSGLSGALLRAWEMRFQFMFYYWLRAQIDGKPAQKFIVNAMIKPKIRIKQAETLAGFLIRLRNEIRADPSKYFYRESLILTKGKMEKFEKETLAPKLNRIALIQNPDTSMEVLSSIVFNRNTEACIDSVTGAQCPFLSVCDKDLSHFQLPTRKHKHPELHAHA